MPTPCSSTAAHRHGPRRATSRRAAGPTRFRASTTWIAGSIQRKPRSRGQKKFATTKRKRNTLPQPAPPVTSSSISYSMRAWKMDRSTASPSSARKATISRHRHDQDHEPKAGQLLALDADDKPLRRAREVIDTPTTIPAPFHMPPGNFNPYKIGLEMFPRHRRPLEQRQIRTRIRRSQQPREKKALGQGPRPGPPENLRSPASTTTSFHRRFL